MKLERKVVVRDAVKDDIPFVLVRWLESFKSSPFAKKIKNKYYWTGHRSALIGILADPNTIVRIACLRSDPKIILGFIVVTSCNRYQAAHYAYVKKDFRKMGIAALLAKKVIDREALVYFTHLTKDSHWICGKLPNLDYNPYAIFLGDASWEKTGLNEEPSEP